MTDLTKLLEQLGSNFVKSAVIPSLIFVIAVIVTFDSIFHITSASKFPLNSYPLVSLGVIILILTIIVGYTLTALNAYMFKVFEGIIIPFPIRFIYTKSQRIHMRNAYSMKKHLYMLESRIRFLEKKLNLSQQEENEFNELKDNYYSIAAYYNLHYPENLADMRPTQFGNIIKATENYTGERYGFDSVHFFPRLLQSIPNDSRLVIDNARNELILHVNMALLSVAFSFLCVFAIFYSMSSVAGAGSEPSIFLEFLTSIIKYFIGIALGFASCGLFYRTSVIAVGDLSLVLRSTADIYRLDLL